MSAGNSNTISVEIMGRQHQFACSAEQEEGLKQAASNLDFMFKDIKHKTNAATNNERALLVAALNLSYQLLSAKNDIATYQEQHNRLIDVLKKAL
ncbi:cell division protein ZapA [Colwellia asteriadis]|uniref:Cell division protein ZapA n=1 Tax=Colwellia asteriadis TaxID=517723 RepID=A0ABN1L2X7_9GAMM